MPGQISTGTPAQISADTDITDCLSENKDTESGENIGKVSNSGALDISVTHRLSGLKPISL